jgi:hypothetical protein
VGDKHSIMHAMLIGGETMIMACMMECSEHPKINHPSNHPKINKGLSSSVSTKWIRKNRHMLIGGETDGPSQMINRLEFQGKIRASTIVILEVNLGHQYRHSQTCKDIQSIRAKTVKKVNQDK